LFVRFSSSVAHVKYPVSITSLLLIGWPETEHDFGT